MKPLLKAALILAGPLGVFLGGCAGPGQPIEEGAGAAKAGQPAKRTLTEQEAYGSGSASHARMEGFFPNVVFTTHEGRKVRFYDDLIKGKAVLINFMFTTCDGI